MIYIIWAEWMLCDSEMLLIMLDLNYKEKDTDEKIEYITTVVFVLKWT